MFLRLVYSNPPSAMPAIMSAPIAYAVAIAMAAAVSRLLISFGSR